MSSLGLSHRTRCGCRGRRSPWSCGRMSTVLPLLAALLPAAMPDAYTPLLRSEWNEMLFEAPVSAVSRFEDASRYRIDRRGTEIKDRALSSQLRVGARFD